MMTDLEYTPRFTEACKKLTETQLQTASELIDDLIDKQQSDEKYREPSRFDNKLDKVEKDGVTVFFKNPGGYDLELVNVFESK